MCSFGIRSVELSGSDLASVVRVGVGRVQSTWRRVGDQSGQALVVANARIVRLTNHAGHFSSAEVFAYLLRLIMKK